MALYAVGDLQGCLDSLKELLEKIKFDPVQDELWLTGDLVSRGPDSLGTLRFLQKLGECTRCVLGNHDLHLLRIDVGLEAPPRDGTLDAILQAPDRHELIEWLRHHPLLLIDHSRKLVMAHAGLLPQWDLDKAATLADEVAAQLRAKSYRDFLRDVFGNNPNRWRDDLEAAERWRAIINVLTRMRFCKAEGEIALEYKREPGTQPREFSPWFEWPHRRNPEYTLIFGHWSSLGFVRSNGVICLDTGCVWNQELTALRMDPGKEKRFSVQC